MKGYKEACPSCREVLFTYTNIKGESDHETMCPHCGSMIQVRIEMKPKIHVKNKDIDSKEKK